MIKLDKEAYIEFIDQRLEIYSFEEKIEAIMGYVATNYSRKEIEEEKEELRKKFPDISIEELTWVTYKFLAQKNLISIQKLLDCVIKTEEAKCKVN